MDLLRGERRENKMKKLISQLEKLAQSNLDLKFEGSEILVSENDQNIHIATCDPDNLGNKKILYNLHLASKQDNACLSHQISYIGLREDENLHILLCDSSGGNLYPYYVLHSNAEELLIDDYSVARVQTKDYEDRVKELHLLNKVSRFV